MSDVTLTYKGATIAELNASGNKTLKTSGKYCDADIQLEYVKSGSYESPFDVPAEYQRLEYLETDASYPRVSAPFIYGSGDYIILRVLCTHNQHGYAAGKYSDWNIGIHTANKLYTVTGFGIVGFSWDYYTQGIDDPATAILAASSGKSQYSSIDFGGFGSNYHFIGKLYYLVIVRPIVNQTNNDIIPIISQSSVVYTLIPCYRKSDGVNGFYDTVNNNFYTTVQGAFTRGPEVN